MIRGIGFTVLPYSAISTLHRGGQLTAAPIQGLEVSWTLVSAKDRSFSLAGHRLRDRLTETLHQQSRQGWWRGVRWSS